jgi:hypothetical protein
MKKILIAAALLAGVSFADTTSVAPKFDTTGLKARIDSLRKADSTLESARLAKFDSVVKVRKAKDSTAFVKHADSAKVDSVRKAWKSVALADSGTRKLLADSLKKVFEGKRDSAIAKIKDTAVQAKIKAHLADIEAKKAEVKAKIEAKKAEIKAKKETPAATN